MQKYVFPLFILANILLLRSSCCGQEGHPGWWWSVQKADLVVEGKVTYDQNSYYEVNPINAGPDKPELKGQKYYWLVGELKITKIIYINRYSSSLEDYQQYAKSTEKPAKILIPALNGAVFATDVPQSQSVKPYLSPILMDLPAGVTICALDNIFLFPLLNLKLETCVPLDKLDEARKVANSRLNNLIGK